MLAVATAPPPLQLTIHRPEDPTAEHPILTLKGAPERVLRMCTHIMVDGESVPMDANWQAKYNEAYEALGAMGERVLGFAYREMTDVALDYPFTNKPEPNFEFKVGRCRNPNMFRGAAGVHRVQSLFLCL